MNKILIRPKNIVTVSLGIHDGWCKRPYQGHPKGCGAINSCAGSFHKTNTYDEIFDSKAIAWCIWEEFDLETHAKRMKLSHPKWSDKMCRNLLYWQGSIRKKRNENVKKFFQEKELGDRYACITKGFSINVYKTLKNAGINLEPIKGIKKVKVVCFICKFKSHSVSHKEKLRLEKYPIFY